MDAEHTPTLGELELQPITPENNLDLLVAARRYATELSGRWEMQTPDLYVTSDADDMAAYTRNREGQGEVIFTQKLLDSLDAPALRAILAHEMSHLRRRDAWRTYTAHTGVPIAAVAAALLVEPFIHTVVIAGSTFVAGAIAARAYMRRCERVADDVAAEIADADALARAYETADSID